jgi:hypothetical protein
VQPVLPLRALALLVLVFLALARVLALVQAVAQPQAD